MNEPNLQNLKFVPVEHSHIESVAYIPASRQLIIKFNNQMPTLSFANVPGFRYDGLLAAPRKDAYYKTFIENHFLTQQVKLA